MRAAFLGFSVEGARCFKEDERQHLLGVIETGFGSLEQFSSLVAGIFSQEQHEDAQRRRSSIRTLTSQERVESRVSRS